MLNNMESKVDSLATDEECSYCNVPLHKGTEFYRHFVNEEGEIIYECDRCSAINADERLEIVRVRELSKKEMDDSICAFETDHTDMLAMSEMDSSLNGALDFESWMSTAKEVLSSTSSDTKTISIMPDETMSNVVNRMKEVSFAEMEFAKSEWTEKSKHFLSPSDADFIYGGLHGPDSMSYQDWRGSSIPIPTPKDGIAVSEELSHLRSKWLKAEAMNAYGFNASNASNAHVSGGAAGGAGRGDDDAPVMSERQRRLLGLN